MHNHQTDQVNAQAAIRRALDYAERAPEVDYTRYMDAEALVDTTLSEQQLKVIMRCKGTMEVLEAAAALVVISSLLSRQSLGDLLHEAIYGQNRLNRIHVTGVYLWLSSHVRCDSSQFKTAMEETDTDSACFRECKKLIDAASALEELMPDEIDDCEKSQAFWLPVANQMMTIWYS